LTKPKAKEQRFYCCSSSQYKNKTKKEEKKSIYQTGARDRIELAVRCERLLHVEGLTVTLR
jgi:hypothetical protein